MKYTKIDRPLNDLSCSTCILQDPSTLTYSRTSPTVGESPLASTGEVDYKKMMAAMAAAVMMIVMSDLSSIRSD